MIRKAIVHRRNRRRPSQASLTYTDVQVTTIDSATPMVIFGLSRPINIDTSASPETITIGTRTGVSYTFNPADPTTLKVTMSGAIASGDVVIVPPHLPGITARSGNGRLAGVNAILG